MEADTFRANGLIEVTRMRLERRKQKRTDQMREENSQRLEHHRIEMSGERQRLMEKVQKIKQFRVEYKDLMDSIDSAMNRGVSMTTILHAIDTIAGSNGTEVCK